MRLLCGDRTSSVAAVYTVATYSDKEAVTLVGL